MSTSEKRQAWLEKSIKELRSQFQSLNYNVPKNVRVSIGFPHKAKKAIGQCWDTTASSDKVFEIFISPKLGQDNDEDLNVSMEILGVIAHELAHAIVGIKEGHNKVFGACARAIGLDGPLTATHPSDEFKVRMLSFIPRNGHYPAGKITLGLNSGPKKQRARLLKAECPNCGYIVRVTNKWVEDVGAPHCPNHGKMEVNNGIQD